MKLLRLYPERSITLHSCGSGRLFPGFEFETQKAEIIFNELGFSGQRIPEGGNMIGIVSDVNKEFCRQTLACSTANLSADLCNVSSFLQKANRVNDLPSSGRE